MFSFCFFFLIFRSSSRSFFFFFFSLVLILSLQRFKKQKRKKTHQNSYIKPRAAHSRDAAALQGSSRVRLPRWLAEHVFMNINEHHIHHFDARVPCYRLRECHEAMPEEVWARAGVHSLGLKEVREALGLALWDEEKEAHVPFPPLFASLGKPSWSGVVGRLRSVVAGKAS